MRRGERRIAPPLTSCRRSFSRRSQKMRASRTMRTIAPIEEHEHQPGVVGEKAELDRERAADGEEEVEVEGDVEDREGDLLDDQAGEDEREGRAGDQGGEHDQHHEGAEVGRQEAVERHRHRVAGEDQPVGHDRAGQRCAQDAVPGERGKARLGALQRHAGDDRPGRHVADLVEEVVDPLEGGHAEQLEQAKQERNRAEPECDAREPAGHRRHPSQPCWLAERRRRCKDRRVHCD